VEPEVFPNFWLDHARLKASEAVGPAGGIQRQDLPAAAFSLRACGFALSVSDLLARFRSVEGLTDFLRNPG